MTVIDNEGIDDDYYLDRKYNIPEDEIKNQMTSIKLKPDVFVYDEKNKKVVEYIQLKKGAWVPLLKLVKNRKS